MPARMSGGRTEMSDTKTNDGGFAFARAAAVSTNESYIEHREQDGMSLLDWMAGQALAGLLSCHGMPWEGDASYANTVKGRVLAAYDLAAAMIAEREKRMGKS